jgi:hypothetical protein
LSGFEGHCDFVWGLAHWGCRLEEVVILMVLRIYADCAWVDGGICLWIFRSPTKGVYLTRELNREIAIWKMVGVL